MLSIGELPDLLILIFFTFNDIGYKTPYSMFIRLLERIF
jgi:hypothetical protein